MRPAFVGCCAPCGSSRDRVAGGNPRVAGGGPHRHAPRLRRLGGDGAGGSGGQPLLGPRVRVPRPAWRAREQYGSSSEQLPLMANEAPQTAPPAATPPTKERRRKSERKPRELPAHLPRETHVHHPKGYTAEAPCSCSECGGKLRE